MNEKYILGLDLGTNSIGWAVVQATLQENGTFVPTNIHSSGSRIIPMDAAMQSDFAKGNSISQTADRTHYRGVRRLLERQLLRRERLHRVLGLMGFLPPHYQHALTRYGKFKNHAECLLAWDKDENGRATFLFTNSFNEMLQCFWQAHPELMHKQMKVPYDWTIYYLRQKALTEAISAQELAWILLHFNQKRGYYQTRQEEQEEEKSKQEEYYALKVVGVEDSGDKKGKDTWWNVILENGMIYRRTAREKPDWVGKIKEFIVTTQLNPDGSPKTDNNGVVKRSFRMPSENDWNLMKMKTQADIRRSQLTVGAYIFQALLANPKQKIKGKLVRTIEREFYKEELYQILEAQKAFIPQLNDRALFADCIQELYPQNDAYRTSIAHRDFTYLFVEDILFYQRPLKSKKSLIDNCPYESHAYLNKDGEADTVAVKCIAKSHPLYQEFRLWQWIGNLRIFTSQADAQGRLVDVDVTDQFLPDETAKAHLFDFLNNRPSITQKDLLEKFFKVKRPKGKDGQLPYRWNYVQDKSYPCNTTRGDILTRLSKAGIATNFLTPDAEEHLWHILYSVSDRQELGKALHKFATRHQLGDDFTTIMAKFPPFESAYGAYSAKAIKKLLPLMRMGHHWNPQDIDAHTAGRIQKIIDGEADETIRQRVREKSISITSINACHGLPLWLACYIVYDRHSEMTDNPSWHSPEDIDQYLRLFRQHSLRNPVVEQIVTETLRTVRDIWKQTGHIDEIHIEMGRDLKNPADKRARLTEQALQNENANLRIKALLTEFMNPAFEIVNVRPYSPSQQEILRIYEDTALNSVDTIEDEITDILKKFTQSDISKRPTRSEVMRYKLWLEQHYVSPYTGQPISLARLFTHDYEIEHIIPQSRYFDDSLSNKVICEAEVNKLKDNTLGYEFIKRHHGEKVTLNGGRVVTILETDSYNQLVARTYKNNRTKMKKLLMDDIPAEFIERQLNDSRYISKLVKGLLSNIVREPDEQEATSKHVIVCSGSVTDRLKREWGIHEVWNHLILPRFERMNQLTETALFTTTSATGHLIPDMPLALQKGFNKKRIDHRHHAMDAIVIACTTRDHVNLLSNEAASPKSNLNRQQLSHKLRRYEEIEVRQHGMTKKVSVAKEFKMPWPSFPADVENMLKDIIVSFKQNTRVINKTSNHSLRITEGKKQSVAQTKGDSWAIRKSMHKETVYGEINLRRVKTAALKEAMLHPQQIVHHELKKKINELLLAGYNEKQIKAYFTKYADAWQDVNLKKIELYYFTRETGDRFFATRKPIDTSFTKEVILAKIADTGIQKIMLRHLDRYHGNAEQAFSPDGIEEMNRTLCELNDGKEHQPIYKVRVYEKADKFTVGQTGNKSKKFVEAAKGTNLFFAVYESTVLDEKTGKEQTKRSFRTIPLNEAILKLKQGLPLDEQALFILSPNDLVYVPTEDEIKSGTIKTPLDRDRIYKMVDASKSMANFVQYFCSSIIFSVSKEDSKHYAGIQNEYGVGSPKSKNERAITGEMIKEICIPLQIDRLGNIIHIGV